jgi:hypothetical protein
MYVCATEESSTLLSFESSVRQIVTMPVSAIINKHLEVSARLKCETEGVF